MVAIKFCLLGFIFVISALIGITISKKYGTRVKELKEIQRALHIFEEKIKFTYEPIPDVFEDIAKKCTKNIGDIFNESAQLMNVMSAGEAWEVSLEKANTKLTKDDMDVLKGMAKMLGRTDLDGQVSEIRLTEKFIDTKIDEAEIEKKKNEKLYKTLGVTIGLTVVIVLV